MTMSRRSFSPHHARRSGIDALGSIGSPVLGLIQSLFSPAAYGAADTKVNASRRILVATVAAVIVFASVAGTGFAGQQRYEAHEGETVSSVAAAFGVDPEAIRSSSFLSNGDALSSGEVIIIPEPGQSPSDAARMAAEREGTSPFVEAAYWVESGDTVAGIAATYGVNAGALAEFNGITDPANLPVGSRILIPYIAG